MVLSIHAKKAFDKIQHPCMIKKKKNSPESSTEETYIKIIKAIYDKPTVNKIMMKR